MSETQITPSAEPIAQMSDSDIHYQWRPSLPFLEGRMVGGLNSIHDAILGQILTLVDTFGFDEKRDKATKDLIRKIVASSLKSTGRMFDEVLQDIRLHGFDTQTDEIDYPSTSAESYRRSKSVVIPDPRED